ncbi:MAG: D-hexose-6-phosphate mutarotase [Mariprofundaceae bacterium]|nr:D-hexose-6-phosphate mutarotase [Mariprofundaceae bacterium]
MNTLNQQYGIANTLSFTLGQGDMPVAKISNDLGSASIALQGAHVLSFQPKGEDDLIWMSDDVSFAPQKSLRGGVPICWPWFGPHATEKTLPAHGYARTVNWKPIASKALDDGSTYLCFELDHTGVAENLQVHPLQVTLHITVGSRLQLRLETKNCGGSAYQLSEAMHTYFKVGDVRQVRVEGLDGREYLDKTDHFARKQQQGDVCIEQEIDRVYLNTSGQLRICDAALHRTLVIDSEQSHATIVWNPWIETANKMGDLGKDGYLQMLCVETANAAENTISLAAGERHQMSCTYSVEKHAK